MEITTAFSCGDKGWVFNNERVVQLTVGQVRVVVTNSDGINDGVVEAGCGIAFDNYKPQVDREEAYMCVETGIGSGAVYTLGKHIFKTEEECRSAFAQEITRREEEKAAALEWRKRDAAERLARAKAEVAALERAIST